MPRYRLNALGDVEFEGLVQTLLKRIVGPGTTSFGPGRDGAREAIFTGAAPYPSKTEEWSGDWIFQAKFHDTDQTGPARARGRLITEAKDELEKLTQKYKRNFDN